ncbi:BSD-domain protein, putative [Plasmodium gallinaceum]|uniref:BSD-domain protein, putative n=1 Tax=Plasmodium gallinaceum TaxID=5849 RepID=A0A1J1GVW9_PLAGA|nr:BSD-domain protein, putative [Plasmodium gallinaceum]CRG96698.1 BSD-domain protein, putative [Plasmodium gallinaceum]
MYSLWKEVSEQIKKKAEDLNTTFQELNINNISKDNGKQKGCKLNERESDKTIKDSIHDKLNLINNKYLNKDFCELQYYNNKFINGFNNIKKIVGDIYKDKLNNLSNDDSDKKKLYLSKIVPWKKADIMISKIYRKKYEEGFPINLPNNNLNNEVYEKILKLNLDRNRILNTNILENYNFNWIKKKEQSEKIMQEDENLITTKSFLVPSYMSEIDFWKSYFFNIDIIYNEIADEIYENKKNILMSYESEYTSSRIGNKLEDQKNNHSINENTLNNLNCEHTKNKSEDKNDFKIEDKLNSLNEVNYTNNIKEEKHFNFENEINKQHPKIENDINNTCKINNEININNLNSLNISDYSQSNSHSNKKNYNIDIITKNNLETNLMEAKEDNIISEKFISTSVNEEEYVKNAKINGLNIYMDNDIYFNLSEKSNKFSKFLNNSDYNDKKEDILFSSNKIKSNTLNENYIISEKKLKGNTEQNDSTYKKGKDDNNISLNEMKDKLYSPLDISEYNLKLLEEINQSNKKEYENDYQNNSYESFSSNNNINEEKGNIYSNFECNDKNSNNPSENITNEENNNTSNFVSCKNESILIESDPNKKTKNNYKNSTKNEIENVLTSDNNNSVNIGTKKYGFNEKKETQKEYENCYIDSYKNMLDDTCKENNIFPSNMDCNKIYKDFKNSENSLKSDCIIIKNDKSNFELKENEVTQSYNFLNEINSINTMNNMNVNSEKVSSENMSKENSYFDILNNSTHFKNIEETKENINFNVDNLIDLSSNKIKNDSDNFLKSSDINIDEINFGDDLEFDFYSNKFNAEELEQFEKDLLNA